MHHPMMHHDVMLSKELVAATSKPLILAILGDGDSYGYAIIQRVRELTEGELEWTDSMLYQVLHRLEKRGLVTSYWQTAESGRKRKYYTVSSTGTVELTETRRQWQVADDALGRLWGAVRVEP